MRKKDNFDFNGYYDIDYKEDYMTKHNRIKMLQEPIVIEDNDSTMLELYDIFEEFIEREDCNKLLISFSKYVKIASHTFMIDLIIDKLYVYGKTIITFTSARPDMDVEMRSTYDDIIAYYNSEVNDPDLAHDLLESFNAAATNNIHLCNSVSDGKININVYSNCKLKYNE